MAELHWFPFYAADWLSSAAVSAMVPEQEGAYIRLLAAAWGNGSAEPSLPDDDRALAQMSRLGARWRKLGPLVRAQFEVRDGRLVNARQLAVWLEQQTKHATAVAKASAGGKAKAERERSRKRATSSASSTPEVVLEGCSNAADTETEPEGEAGRALTGTVLPSPAAAALAPADAAPRSAAEDDRTPAARLRDHLRAAADGPRNLPSGNARPADVTGIGALGEAERALQVEYRARLRQRVEQYAERHPDQYTAHLATAQQEAAVFPEGPLRDRGVEGLVLDAIRAERGWPTFEQWLAERVPAA